MTDLVFQRDGMRRSTTLDDGTGRERLLVDAKRNLTTLIYRSGENARGKLLNETVEVSLTDGDCPLPLSDKGLCRLPAQEIGDIVWSWPDQN